VTYRHHVKGLALPCLATLGLETIQKKIKIRGRLQSAGLTAVVDQ
jgi:hypothetical protein